MTTFNDREKAYESKFAHDEALKFRSIARRNKLLGAWAAEQLKKSGADAEAYTLEVLRADLAEAGDDDVRRKIQNDFEKAGIEIPGGAIRQKMGELLVLAAQQIESET